jgi:putative endonuclease
VYILTNERHTVLYIGVTADLPRRIQEHKNGLTKGFTHKYNVHKLVYASYFEDITYALAHEKILKNWKRVWKEELISKDNPDWEELSPL